VDLVDTMTNRSVYIRNGDVVVRQATPSDYQSVMDIDHNIYDGHDYMPLMFHQFLQSRHHLVLVTECEGEIVSNLIANCVTQFAFQRKLLKCSALFITHNVIVLTTSVGAVICLSSPQ